MKTQTAITTQGPASLIDQVERTFSWISHEAYKCRERDLAVRFWTIFRKCEKQSRSDPSISNHV